MNDLASKFYTKSLEELGLEVLEQISLGFGGYIILQNVRVFSKARYEKNYNYLCENAKYLIADGFPISFIINKFTDFKISHIRGFDLFFKISRLVSTQKPEARILFIVSSPELANRVTIKFKTEFPNIENVCVLPALWGDAREIFNNLEHKIEEFKPDLTWVCVSAPKQDYISSYISKLRPTCIAIGVGLVAEYFSGDIRRPPEWVLLYRLEWLYRAIKHPKRIKNFIGPFFSFITYSISLFFTRIRVRK